MPVQTQFVHVEPIPRYPRVIFSCWVELIDLPGNSNKFPRDSRDESWASRGKSPRLALKSARDTRVVHAKFMRVFRFSYGENMKNPCKTTEKSNHPAGRTVLVD